MSVGWERAARRVDREAAQRTARRERLREGRRQAAWRRATSVASTCGACGDSVIDAYTTATGARCFQCFGALEVSAALAPATLVQRMVLALSGLPTWGLVAGVLALVRQDGWSVKYLIALFMLSSVLFAFSLWGTFLNGITLDADLARHSDAEVQAAPIGHTALAVAGMLSGVGSATGAAVGMALALGG
ncbi:MAG: hypothetical protein KC912_10680 [Proteobacteria bacterium]|nr:hypothetical protein [Pseudomonadota bacterium]